MHAHDLYFFAAYLTAGILIFVKHFGRPQGTGPMSTVVGQEQHRDRESCHHDASRRCH